MPHRAASPAVSENEFDITNSLFKDDVENTTVDLGILDAGGILDLGQLSDDDGDEAFIAGQQAASNRKASNLKGRTVKKGGGFQAMGIVLWKSELNPTDKYRTQSESSQGNHTQRLLCADTNSAKNHSSRTRWQGCCWHGKDRLWKNSCIRYTND